MRFEDILSRLQGRYQRKVSGIFSKRPVDIRTDVAHISFTFDDFPRSALHVGGKILMEFGLNGTYYAAMGLMDSAGPTGDLFTVKDLEVLIHQGHELGCHTHSHCDSWDTTPDVFEKAIVENRTALKRLLPAAVFQSCSYPLSNPRPGTKRRAEKYFACCRGGGQTFNTGTADLNMLKAFFIEKKRNDIDFIKSVIDQNADSRGWLIFATHDVSGTPTQFGCSPGLFEQIVAHSVESGATVLPVVKTLESIRRWHESQPGS